MEKDYGSWSLANIKQELKKRRARMNGRKADLVKRLEDYDKHFNFTVTDVDGNNIEEYLMDVPSPLTYKDVNAESTLPSLSDDCLTIFSSSTNIEDSDRALHMYEGKKNIIFLRFSSTVNKTYFVGSCASEFRKKITYKVDVVLQNHLFTESQCECAAGMGPLAHCKHVLVVLWSIWDIIKNCKLNIQETCTSRLQTFNKTKKYHGSPLKALNLKIKRGNTILINDFDPRPAKLRHLQQYADNFKNSINNFASYHKNETMPLLNLIPPANIPCVFEDHPYSLSSYTDSAKQLTTHEIKTLEIDTRGQRLNKLWFQERLIRLSSSNFGTICFATDETDKFKLARSFLQYKEVRAAAVLHGIQYEGSAVKKFEAFSNLETAECGLYVDQRFQFLCSSPDRVIGDNAVLEVKCPFTSRYKNITPETVPCIHLCERTGELKLNESHSYYYQIQGQLYCTNRATCYFVVFTFVDFIAIIIPRNETVINSIIEKLVFFHNNFFKLAIREKVLYKDYKKYF